MLDLQPVNDSTYPPVPYPSIDMVHNQKDGIMHQEQVNEVQRPKSRQIVQKTVVQHSEMVARFSSSPVQPQQPFAETPSSDSLPPVTVADTATATPKPKPTFRTPFKPPRPVVLPRSVARSPLRSSSSSSPPPSSPLAATFPAPAPPPSRPRPIVARPRPTFTPLRRASRSSAKNKTTSPAVELTQLERRVQLLRQAVKYRRSTLRGDGSKEDEGALEGLCERWRDAGRSAAELLWDHAGAMLGDSTAAVINSSARPLNGNNGGWSSTWGFASSSPPPAPYSTSSPFDSSWGFASSSSSTVESSHFFDLGPARPQTSEAELRAMFDSRVEEEMQCTGKSRKEVMREMEEQEDDEGGLPSLEGLLELQSKEGGKRSKVAGKGGVKKKVKLDQVGLSDDDEEEEEQSSDEEMLRALDVMIAERSSVSDGRREGEETESSLVHKVVQSDAEEEQEEQQTWNVGKLMQGVGIDPSLFGWDAEEEEFIA